jgi:hypothetical protein
MQFRDFTLKTSMTTSVVRLPFGTIHIRIFLSSTAKVLRPDMFPSGITGTWNRYLRIMKKNMTYSSTEAQDHGGIPFFRNSSKKV